MFDCKNTYYYIEETNKTWSTKRGIFVVEGDAELEEFIESDNQPISLQTEAQLVDTLEIYELPRGIFTVQLPQEAQKKFFVNAIQNHLDDFAKTRNYDGILSATTYATSKIQKFASEGQYAVEARDTTWAAGYTLMEEVLTGVKPIPTLDELLALMPPLKWPDEE